MDARQPERAARVAEVISMAVTARLMTADEFECYQEPDDQHCELVAGAVVCMPRPNPQHGQIAAALVALLTSHVRSRRLGVVFTESGFVLARGPDTVRGPDMSFLSAARMPIGDAALKFFDGAPDLAVEVLSPSDRQKAMAEKVAEYFAAGTRLVWVIDPKQRTAIVYTPAGSPQPLGDDDLLDGRDVVPGFACALRDVLDW